MMVMHLWKRLLIATLMSVIGNSALALIFWSLGRGSSWAIEVKVLQIMVPLTVVLIVVLSYLVVDHLPRPSETTQFKKGAVCPRKNAR